MQTAAIRHERSVEGYSDGSRLVRDIQAMWESNRCLPPGSNEEIERRILTIMVEHDLSLVEWHYWAREASNAPNR